MRRAPLVLAGTVAGLVGVLGFHTSGSTNLSIAAPAGSSGSPATRSGGAGGTRPGGSGASGSTTTTAPPASGTNTSATGSVVQYGYGELAVKVTLKGGKIASVSVPILQVAEQYSQQLADQAIPVLTSEVLQAQSAQINGVSGATYTAQAYVTSLQAALDALHAK